MDQKSDVNFCEELAVPDPVDKQTHSFEALQLQALLQQTLLLLPGKKQAQRAGNNFTTALAYALIEDRDLKR